MWLTFVNLILYCKKMLSGHVLGKLTYEFAQLKGGSRPSVHCMLCQPPQKQICSIFKRLVGCYLHNTDFCCYIANFLLCFYVACNF